MKKIVKMSLVAAVAVAGLTTANAKPLEEAIKDVDVSGTVVYRYNDVLTDNATGADTNAQNNNYKAAINLTSKVNDDVTANFRVVTGTGISDDQNFATLNTSTAADANPSFHLSEVYFGYTGIKNTTVKIGKQGLTTPWTVAQDSDSNEQTGTGILALTTWSPVTIAGAYFNQTNLSNSGVLSGVSVAGIPVGANDVATVGAIVGVGPVTVDAWYLDMQDLFDTYTIGAKAALDMDGINLGASLRYTSLTIDNTTISNAVGHGTEVDNDAIVASLTAKAGIVDAKLVYAKTDEKGGLIGLDNDVATNVQGWGVSLNNKADADYFQAVLGVQALDSLHISANYVTVEYDDSVNSAVQDEQTEMYAQFVYKMSKNLMTYVRYGVDETKDTSAGTKTESDYKGRLQVQYSF